MDFQRDPENQTLEIQIHKTRVPSMFNSPSMFFCSISSAAAAFDMAPFYLQLQLSSLLGCSVENVPCW